MHRVFGAVPACWLSIGPLVSKSLWYSNFLAMHACLPVMWTYSHLIPEGLNLYFRPSYNVNIYLWLSIELSSDCFAWWRHGMVRYASNITDHFEGKPSVPLYWIFFRKIMFGVKCMLNTHLVVEVVELFLFCQLSSPSPLNQFTIVAHLAADLNYPNDTIPRVNRSFTRACIAIMHVCWALTDDGTADTRSSAYKLVTFREWYISYFLSDIYPLHFQQGDNGRRDMSLFKNDDHPSFYDD